MRKFCLFHKWKDSENEARRICVKCGKEKSLIFNMKKNKWSWKLDNDSPYHRKKKQ